MKIKVGITAFGEGGHKDVWSNSDRVVVWIEMKADGLLR